MLLMQIESAVMTILSIVSDILYYHIIMELVNSLSQVDIT